MFEDAFAPPIYTDLYNFKDGAQDDIFQDSYPSGIPAPSPEQTIIPTPVLDPSAASPTATAPASSTTSSAPQGRPSALFRGGSGKAKGSSSSTRNLKTIRNLRRKQRTSR